MKKKWLLFMTSAAMSLNVTGCTGDEGQIGNVFSINVGDDKYTFDMETGVTNFNQIEKAWSITNQYKNGLNIIEVDDGLPYFAKANGMAIMDERLEADDVKCLVGEYCEAGDIDWYGPRLRSISGIGGLNPIKNIIAGTNDYGAYYWHEKKDNEDIENVAAAVELAFVNDYKIDGLTQNSSVEDILAKGYKANMDEGMYYNIYSPAKVDWEAIESDYNKLDEANLTHLQVVSGEYENYIDYGAAARWIVSTIIGKGSDFAMFNSSFSGLKDAYTSLLDRNGIRPRTNAFDSEMLFSLALSQQIYKLCKGEINYFIVTTIDTTNYEKSKYYIKNKDDYTGNRARVYIFTNGNDIHTDKETSNIEKLRMSIGLTLPSDPS